MRLRHIEVFHAIMQVGTISGAADCGTSLTAHGLSCELIGHADNDPLGELVVAACEAQDIHPVFSTVVQAYQIARSPLSHGARRLADSIGVAARNCLERGV